MRRYFHHTIALMLLFCLMPPLGHTICPKYTFVKIVDSETPVPGGDGSPFSGLSLSVPAVDGEVVAFRGEGGGIDGVFAGDGNTLSPMAAVGDAITGGGTITSIFDDFAFSGGIVTIIALNSSAVRGIYSTDDSGLNKIVAFGDSEPGGSTFSTIHFVSSDGENLTFQANIKCCVPRSAGIYTNLVGVNELVVDTTTVIPGSAPTTFGSFSSDPDISGQNIAFHSGFGALTGIYANLDGSLTKVADVNDTEPGGNQTFTTLSIPAISGQKVAFRGAGDKTGIYIGDGGPLTVIAQTGDPAPGGSTFSGFGPDVAFDGENVAFSASGSGFSGLFVSDQLDLCRVIDTDDTLEGKDITQLFMGLGRDSFSQERLGFLAVFADGSRGIYLAKPQKRFPIDAIRLLLDDSK